MNPPKIQDAPISKNVHRWRAVQNATTVDGITDGWATKKGPGMNDLGTGQ